MLETAILHVYTQQTKSGDVLIIKQQLDMLDNSLKFFLESHTCVIELDIVIKLITNKLFDKTILKSILEKVYNILQLQTSCDSRNNKWLVHISNIIQSPTSVYETIRIFPYILSCITEKIKNIRISIINANLLKFKRVIPLVCYELEIEQLQLALTNNTIKLDKTVDWLLNSRIIKPQYVSKNDYVQIVHKQAFHKLLSQICFTNDNIEKHIPEVLFLDINRLLKIRNDVINFSYYLSIMTILNHCDKDDKKHINNYIALAVSDDSRSLKTMYINRIIQYICFNTTISNTYTITSKLRRLQNDDDKLIYHIETIYKNLYFAILFD